jgi:hypothetical protein
MFKNNIFKQQEIMKRVQSNLMGSVMTGGGANMPVNATPSGVGAACTIFSSFLMAACREKTCAEYTKTVKDTKILVYELCEICNNSRQADPFFEPMCPYRWRLPTDCSADSRRVDNC